MKRKILLISLGMLLGSLITVGATILIQSNQVLYKNDTTVEEALNDLYTKSNIGDALASDIKAGKKALVGGKEVTGSLNVPSYTNLSGTQNVGAGAYSTLLNGYYNLSDYRIKCGSNSCSACNSCCPASNIKFGSIYAGSANTSYTISTGLSSISEIVVYSVGSTNGNGFQAFAYSNSLGSGKYYSAVWTGGSTYGCVKDVGDTTCGVNHAHILSISGGNVTFEFGNNYRTNGYLYWFAK